MKSFNEFLTESAKTYNFKIRVAGEVPEGFVDHMKSNLAKYEVVKLSAGKTTPIMEKPLDFPQLQNMEVTHYEVELKYPVTSHILQHYLVDNCNITHAYLVVRGEHDPIEMQQEEKEDKPYEALLTTDDLGGESAQEQVGDAHIMSLLKELEVARKERTIDPMEGAPKGETS
tara:strand:- start:323 stop:838 length:516 start_codon:yes stop_codon:yes gene_type:complete